MIDDSLCRGAGIGPLLLAAALSGGCDRGGLPEELPNVRVDVRVGPGPPTVGRATVEVALSDASGAPIQGADVRVEGNMNHAGMKPEFGAGREVRPGRYEAPIEFTMGGDWFLLIDVRLADGRALRKQIDVPAVRTR